MLTLNDGRSELWQWDTGRRLSVDAECSQVHFSNKVFGRSVDVDVVDGVAIVPDILLQTDKDLNAWAFVGTAESGYTKISKVFKVNKRNKPSDYVFTPTDQTTLDDILDRIEDLEKRPSGGNGGITKEVDPTVPDWAKQSEKPKYTASEVGALSQGELQAGIDLALEQARNSGVFDGDPGKSAYQYALDGGYTGTEEEFAQKLAADVAGGAQKEWTLVGSYVHSGNKVIQPDSVDIATGVWTVNAGHGLENGDIVCAFVNDLNISITADTVKKIPGAFGMDSNYGFVVAVIDEYTFTLGYGSAGTTKLDLSGATEVDCSLFRFEERKFNTNLCEFTGLQDYKDVMILCRGQAGCSQVKAALVGTELRSLGRTYEESYGKTTTPYTASVNIYERKSLDHVNKTSDFTVGYFGNVVSQAEMSINHVDDRIIVKTEGGSLSVTQGTTNGVYNGAIHGHHERASYTGTISGMRVLMYYKSFVANGFTVEVFAK